MPPDVMRVDMPDVQAVRHDIPAWRWGTYWGEGEGLEWTLFRPNPISLMLQTENELFDSNNWAMRINLFFCSLYVRIHMPWYVENRKLFIAWYPTLGTAHFYIEWKNKFIRFF
jgi:hypothetical protein